MKMGENRLKRKKTGENGCNRVTGEKGGGEAPGHSNPPFRGRLAKTKQKIVCNGTTFHGHHNL